ncbi:hypothetical protein B0T10DRAFT_463473 [Thelonectria olida]|uniref:Uncharacterized protein n=1 Tax=Thelonectria olida TaxID=1576542 RepID=A0A9P9AKU2_9HYPO|nr:hypothetical protein B0T10DRAFT_463473 [Thelonectria olida]
MEDRKSQVEGAGDFQRLVPKHQEILSGADSLITQTSQNVGEIAETRHSPVARSEVDPEEHLGDKHIVFIDFTGEDDVHIKVEPDSGSRKRRRSPDARPRKWNQIERAQE